MLFRRYTPLIVLALNACSSVDINQVSYRGKEGERIYKIAREESIKTGKYNYILEMDAHDRGVLASTAFENCIKSLNYDDIIKIKREFNLKLLTQKNLLQILMGKKHSYLNPAGKTFLRLGNNALDDGEIKSTKSKLVMTIRTSNLNNLPENIIYQRKLVFYEKNQVKYILLISYWDAISQT